MIFEVRVIVRAKKARVVDEGGGKIKVYTSAAPEKGKANKKVLDALADYFSVERNKIFLISGEKSRQKRIEIDL